MENNNKTSNGRKVLIIGAGIHGVSLAVELAKRGNEVSIIDAKEDILLGTSLSTHNRVHLGYHYPRSKVTAEECRQGYNSFLRDYGDCVIFPEFYYMISKENSNVTAEEYKSAMEDCGLPCVSSFPEEDFINRDQIEDSFKVKEACVDIWKIKDRLKEDIRINNIKEIYNFEIKEAFLTKNKKNLTLISSDSKKIELEVNLIVNCTYTYTNNVQIAFSEYKDLTPYKFETTEIAVVYSDKKIPALTVMDGPFTTILPYAGKENHYLVYDKKCSVIESEIAIKYQIEKNHENSWKTMLERGLKYYPFFKNLQYKYSLYGNRPISLKSSSDDRHTKLIKHDYPIDMYSILEGKFVSAPLIAKKFAKIIDSRETGKMALIGSSGFIGSNLKEMFLFKDFYNSKNIDDIEGKEYDKIISCANSGARWKVNRDPEKDLKSIQKFIEHIKKVKTNKFILISTIDVFENPVDVFENSEYGNLDKNPYGRNRLYLESFVKENFEDYLIIRLPIVYGHGFKKNFIYDILHNKNLNKINTLAQIQIYDVKNLERDINFALKNNLKVLNISSEPIVIKDLLKEIFNLNLKNQNNDESFKYNMKSQHAELFKKEKDYLYDRVETLNDLKKFVKEYEIMRI